MSSLVCPRLGLAAGELEMEELRRRLRRGGLPSVRDLIPFEHRDAAPTETGQPIDKAGLRELRTKVLKHFPSPPEELPPSEFDRTLGRALMTELPFVRSDLFHGGTWSFLTLCVFPDLLCIRWRDFNADRALGTPRRRNVLQRPWIQELLLGEILHLPGVELSADEFVAIVERSSITRVPGLAAMMAEELVRVMPSGRPEKLARVFGTRVVHQTGVLLLDALTREELRVVLTDAAQGALDQVIT